MHADDILDAPVLPAKEPLVYVPGRERVIAGIADFLLLRGFGYIFPRVMINFTYGYWFGVLATTALELIFYVLLVKRNGATPGKMFLNMKIVTADGNALSWYHVFMRYLPLFLVRLCTLGLLLWDEISTTLAAQALILNDTWVLLPVVLTLAWYVISTILVVTNTKRRSLNDLVAGTVVVAAGEKS